MSIHKCISYEVALTGYGWQQGIVNEGMAAGTNVLGTSICGLKITFPNLEYRTYISGQGWTQWSAAGAASGDAATPIESLEIRVQGAPNATDVYLRAMVDGAWGNLAGASQGASAGQPGSGAFLQAVQLFPVLPVETLAGGGLAVPFAEVAAAAPDPAPAAAPVDRLDYVIDSAACIASLGAAGAACVETAGLACGAAGAAVVAACARAVKTGAAFVQGQIAPAPGQTVESPSEDEQPGDTSEGDDDQDAPGPEPEPEPDAPEPEPEPEPDAPEPEPEPEPEPDAPEPEPEPEPDAPEHDAPEPDAPEHDAPEHDAPEPDAPEHDAPEHDAPEHDAPEHDAPEHDAPEHDAPEHDAPEHEAPEHEGGEHEGGEHEGGEHEGGGGLAFAELEAIPNRPKLSAIRPSSENLLQQKERAKKLSRP